MIARRPFYVDEQVVLHYGDALPVLRTLPAGLVNALVTSLHQEVTVEK
jgi:hypothetical protein